MISNKIKISIITFFASEIPSGLIAVGGTIAPAVLVAIYFSTDSSFLFMVVLIIAVLMGNLFFGYIGLTIFGEILRPAAEIELQYLRNVEFINEMKKEVNDENEIAKIVFSRFSENLDNPQVIRALEETKYLTKVRNLKN